MAFPSAPGYGNLPQGNFSPVIYSQKVLKFFKTVSVAEEVTNTEFEGEIKDFGDTVRIIKEPEVDVQDYRRGQLLVAQDLDDDDISMTIDQAKSYTFRMDDIEKRHSHVGFDQLGIGAGAYALRNAFDQNVLNNMLANATTATSTGTDAAPVTIGHESSDDFTPYNLLKRLERFLHDNDVPTDGGRFVVVNPRFAEELALEDSKLIDASVMGEGTSAIRDSKLLSGKPIAGFKVYVSNNAPASTGNSRDTVLAGHTSATATAKNILTSEVIRSERTFGDIYRGLFVFGRKVLRPEALFAAHVTY